MTTTLGQQLLAAKEFNESIDRLEDHVRHCVGIMLHLKDGYVYGGVFEGNTFLIGPEFARFAENDIRQMLTKFAVAEMLCISMSQTNSAQRTFKCVVTPLVIEVNTDKIGLPVAKQYGREPTPVEIPHLKVKCLSVHATIPTFGSPFSAGLDLYAAETITLHPNSITAVKTDLALEIEPMHWGSIRDRSSMVLNRINVRGGVIDSDYRGEICVILHNDGQKPFPITKGNRIAQLILMRHDHIKVVEMEVLSETERGLGRFGSTGQ